LCLAQTIFFELPLNSVGDTEFQTITKHEEEAPLASPQGRRNERQGITISDKIELAHFVV